MPEGKSDSEVYCVTQDQRKVKCLCKFHSVLPASTTVKKEKKKRRLSDQDYFWVLLKIQRADYLLPRHGLWLQRLCKE
jgi:hypothetical protein